MARPVRPEAVASKRKDILDAAQRLVLTVGYEQMSIQDILDEVQMSSGAFHHYFGSRAALLDAFIQRMGQETEKPLLPILRDPHLTAIQKLQGFFDTFDSLRYAMRADLIKLARVWYTDGNALVRSKVDEAVFKQRAPLISEIVRQGMREGSFHVSQPEQAGEVILALLAGMGNTHAGLLLAIDAELRGNAASTPPIADLVNQIVSVHAAYMEAIERVLGAPPGCLARTDAAAVKRWVAAMEE